MGTIPIPSIDTVDTCELGASIDTCTKYRLFRYCARTVYVQRACAKTYVVKSQILFNARYGVALKQRTLKNVNLQVWEMKLD